MALLRFRKISLAEWNALVEKDANTRYIVFNEDGSIYGEFIGEQIVDNETFREEYETLLEDTVNAMKDEIEIDITNLENSKVDKVEGKGLSENDFTTAEKNKLNAIQAGAQVNAVRSVAGKTGDVVVTKSDVGLGNVENTSDIDKPISAATQSALNNKEDKANKAADFSVEDNVKYPTTRAVADKIDVEISAHNVDEEAHNDIRNAVSEVNDRVDEVNGRVDETNFKVRTNELKTSTLEESIRKVEAGDTKGTVSDTEVINLPLNTANGQVSVKLDGMLLDAKQLVENGDFSNGVTGWTPASDTTLNIVDGYLRQTRNSGGYVNTTLDYNPNYSIGSKVYIRYKMRISTEVYSITTNRPFTSVLVNSPVANTWYEESFIDIISNSTIRIQGSMDVGQYRELAYFYSFNISILIANKQYSPLYDTTFDLMTDAEIKLQMDAWIADGTLPNDNVQAVNGNKRVKSVGKNLFDVSKGILASQRSRMTDGLIDASGTYSLTTPIEIKPNTSYVISNSAWSTLYGNALYDKDMNYISGFNTATFTTPANAKYVRIQFLIGNQNIVQLELGTTSTAYELYKSTDIYINAPDLYSVPNQVKDTVEYRNGKCYHIQRVKKIYTLQASDILNIYTSPIDTDYAIIQLGSGYVTTNIANTVYIEGQKGVINFQNTDNIDKIVAYSTATGQIAYGITKGTTLAQAQTLLNGRSICYQLATPIETEILASGNLLGHSKGTVYIENVVADVDVYTTKIDITNTDLPIKTIEKIAILNENGTETLLNVNTAVIDINKLSFTHPNLTANDKVYFIYEYEDSNNVFGLTNVTYFNSNQVIIDSVTGRAYRVVNSVASGVLTQTLEEVL